MITYPEVFDKRLSLIRYDYDVACGIIGLFEDYPEYLGDFGRFEFGFLNDNVDVVGAHRDDRVFKPLGFDEVFDNEFGLDVGEEFLLHLFDGRLGLGAGILGIEYRL